MEFNFNYTKIIERYKVDRSELPNSIVSGINDINIVVRKIKDKERSGESVGAEVSKKLTRLDRWVCGELMDFINETDNNDDEAPVEAKEILDDIEEGTDKKVSADPKGVKIEAELKAMYDNDFRTLTAEKLSNVAPISYDVILQGYEEGGKNGIKTSAYSLIESEKEVFKVTKN